jgi:dihydropteroate synthase
MTAAVMGVVNVTPDSFSDGGRYFEPREALRRAANMVEEGASIIDFGAESTRPGAEPLSWREEYARLEAILPAAVAEFSQKATVSVDTYHPETAELAVKAGVGIVNCVYAESVPAMLDIVKANPSVELVVPTSFLGGGFSLPDSLAALADRIYLDPMIGFSDSREEDIARLHDIPRFASMARVMVGVSRKRLVKRLTGEKVTGKNLGGSLALAMWSVMAGASVVRVHDVRESVQAIKVLDAMGKRFGLTEGECK